MCIAIRHYIKTAWFTLVVLLMCHLSIGQSIWMQPTSGMLTPWGRKIDIDHVLPEYPRPSMERSNWLNLNGVWNYAITDKESGKPAKFDGQILVPFAVESKLSGVEHMVTANDKIWYQKRFHMPENWSYKFIYLHFGAVDWEARIYINGKEIGMHRGGYDPFYFDISYFLKDQGMQELVVEVWDPTDKYHQPHGKQKLNGSGIWYTPVSGIWQTVWLEPIDFKHLLEVKYTPDIDNNCVWINTKVANALPGDSVKIDVMLDEKMIASQMAKVNQLTKIKIPTPKLWSPETPTLYQTHITVVGDHAIHDHVDGYFAMRKIEVKPDKKGIKRIYLNNEPVFLIGLLDQGWWPDGLYTAPCDEALIWDIQTAKNLGFNTLRKHVKVEPERWYYHCDRLGMMVWQDMPNGDAHATWQGPSGIDSVEIERSFRSAAQYKIEFEAIINANYNHPSIIYWTPFNEGWGQFKTAENTEMVIRWDSTRIVGGPSGGNYFPVGHTRDFHMYPGPGLPPADPERALVLGEFGGYGLKVEEHIWQLHNNWGYKNVKNEKILTKNYVSRMNEIPALMKKGLCAAIYTQLSDVEGEVNGLVSYDREIIKPKIKKIHKANTHLKFHYQQIVVGQ